MSLPMAPGWPTVDVNTPRWADGGFGLAAARIELCHSGLTQPAAGENAIAASAGLLQGCRCLYAQQYHNTPSRKP
jgi:hypothetical protein